MSGAVKNGPQRVYEPDELARFAEWQSARMGCKPRQCRGGGACWAVYGPPAITSSMQCVGCGGTPRPRDMSAADAR